MINEIKKKIQANPKESAVVATAAVAAAGVLFAPILTIGAITGYVGWRIFNGNKPPEQPPKP